MNALKFKANVMMAITALFVFCSCSAQTNKEQNQESSSEPKDILSQFGSELIKRQLELYKYDSYLAFDFREKHRRMNLVANLDINKNDTIFIADNIIAENSNCQSIAFNSRYDIACDYGNQLYHYYDVDSLRPFLQKWDKKEIKAKGKRKYIQLDNVGHWYITRVIVQPDKLLLDGVRVDELPHTLTEFEIEMERHRKQDEEDSKRLWQLRSKTSEGQGGASK